MYMTVGSTTSALELFLALEMWEDVIKCYSSLGRLEKVRMVVSYRLQRLITSAGRFRRLYLLNLL